MRKMLNSFYLHIENKGIFMKTVKKNGIRPILISDINIRPTKIRSASSIRPARSLRKTKIQVETPLRALFNRRFQAINKSEE
jgi:homoserine trans-succinylase